MHSKPHFCTEKSMINRSNFLSSITAPNARCVMGIINVTPDSFYDGGSHLSENQILQLAEKHLKEGADLLDIGGMSSRPGAEWISEEEELSRVMPALKSILAHFPETAISIDTFRANVAQQTLDQGAAIINDISASTYCEEMADVIAKYQCPYIIMHIKGIPQTMQQNPSYDDVVHEVLTYFDERINFLKSIGINQLIIDVGFGFGKTLAHNYQLLNHLTSFKKFGYPLLCGVSRKSMLTKLLDINSQDALNATTVANTIALINGANILRVHDVKEAMEAIKIVNAMQDF